MRHGRAFLAAWLVLAALCLPAASAAAQTASAAAEAGRAAAAELEAAMRALDTAEAATDRVAALTRAIRAHEDGLGKLRDSLRQVIIAEQAIRRDLDADSARISRLVGAMSGIGRTASGPQVLLHPSGPLGTARAGGIVADIAPALLSEAEALRHRLATLADLRAVQQAAADTLAEGLATVQAARVGLSQAVAERRDLPVKLTESPEALARLVRSVDTLDAFADLLGDMRLAPDTPVRRFSDARGSLPLPVRGRVLRAFDAPDAAGIRRPGLVVATRPQALVTTPWAATVRYLGPLLDYGNVALIEPEDGYLIVLTGLGTLYGAVGQVLPAGAPIGLMGGSQPEAITLSASGQQLGGVPLTESLYIEIREGNRPVDPAAWFAQIQEQATQE